MKKYLLNYASVIDGDLYCECMGQFDTDTEALEERNKEIAIDKEDYEKEGGHLKTYDEGIVKNGDLLYEWSDGDFTQQYRIQEMF